MDIGLDMGKIDKDMIMSEISTWFVHYVHLNEPNFDFSGSRVSGSEVPPIDRKCLHEKIEIPGGQHWQHSSRKEGSVLRVERP